MFRKRARSATSAWEQHPPDGEPARLNARVDLHEPALHRGRRLQRRDRALAAQTQAAHAERDAPDVTTTTVCPRACSPILGQRGDSAAGSSARMRLPSLTTSLMASEHAALSSRLRRTGGQRLRAWIDGTPRVTRCV